MDQNFRCITSLSIELWFPDCARPQYSHSSTPSFRNTHKSQFILKRSLCIAHRLKKCFRFFQIVFCLAWKYFVVLSEFFPSKKICSIEQNFFLRNFLRKILFDGGREKNLINSIPDLKKSLTRNNPYGKYLPFRNSKRYKLINSCTFLRTHIIIIYHHFAAGFFPGFGENIRFKFRLYPSFDYFGNRTKCQIIIKPTVTFSIHPNQTADELNSISS